MKSVSHRLLVGQTVAVGISAALTVALLVGYETRSARTDQRIELDASVSAFAKVMEPPLWDLDFDRASRLASAFGRDPRIASLVVRERSTGTTQRFTPHPTTDTAFRVMTVRHGDQVIGEVGVAFNRGYYREQISDQTRNAIVVSLIALVVTLIVLRLLLRRLLRRPLDELSNVVRRYGTGRDPSFASAVPYVEFEELGRVLDSMSAQIRDQLAALGSANHELRALNRFLAMAAADTEPTLLIAEAARELRGLFNARCVRIVLTAEDAAPATSYTDPPDAAAEEASNDDLVVPVSANARQVGTMVLARPVELPFTPTERALASTVAAQLGAAISRYRAHSAERLLRTAIEQIPESIIIADSDWRIVYVNPGFSATSGYSTAEAMGRHPRELKRATEEDAAAGSMYAMLEAGKPWTGRLTNAKKSGEVYFEEVVVTPVRDAGGQVAHLVAIGRDVTMEMRRDEQYRHAQRMEAVGQLAGGVAHDFNNLLGAVLLQMELLELEEQLTVPVQRTLQEMRSSLKRAADLTRQLLVFSRRQAMRVELHDLNRVVSDMLRILSRVIGEGIAIDFTPAPRPVVFEGDAGMIEQVVVNLCVNARDAMPNGGRLGITSRAVMLDDTSEHPGTWACLEVRDTGTGIPPEIRPLIFEPFFTTKEVGRGTGLGLATTHGIVTQHGGWIDVESAPGHGSTFRVHLPAQPGLAPESREHPARAAARGDAMILVVEDESLVRQTVSHSLQRLGYRVIEATSGPEALDRWAVDAHAIDLVITDMVMPGGVSGVQLIERMRLTGRMVPAIVMSGYSLQLVSDMLPPSIVFVPKPFSLAALGDAVAEALRQGNGKR